MLREYQNADLEYMKNGVNDPNITANLSDNFLYPHSSYLKCGFQEEGRYRKKIYKNGTYWDSIVMSILKNEHTYLQFRVFTAS